MYVLFSEHRIKPRNEPDFVEAIIATARIALLDRSGCLRFDVFRDLNDANCFRTCEVYADRRVGASRYGGLGLPKQWYARPPTRLRARNVWPGDAGMKTRIGELPRRARRDRRYVHLGVWQIKPQHRAAYVKAMTVNARASVSKEPECYRFDILQDLDDRNRYYLYQIYLDRRTHDFSHALKPHVDKLKATPGWEIWPDRKTIPPIGRISPTRLSHTVRGTVVWSHDAWEKPR
jgi:quinol monooxygenase YgiN